MTSIKFGTSGHRGIIGQTFTVNHLRAIVHAIHEYFKYHKIQTPKVLLGYDTRTGNSPTLEVNSYTCCVVSELVSKRIKVDVSDNYMATPITSWAVKTYNYNLGIILTASHNPPNYNGIKINDANGAPASIDITSWIEKKANDIFPSLNDISYKEIPTKKFNFVNYTEPFTDHLRTLIKDQFHLPPIEFNNKYIIDPKCGAAISVWQALTEHHLGDIIWKNNSHSSTFNNELPDPTNSTTIHELSLLCKKHSSIAFSNDPDADRHVMIDELGNFVTPEKIAAIIINYCHESNIPVQSVASTLANSGLIKLVCTQLKIPIHETKIGFKYFTPFLKNSASKQELSIGVESSGGFSISLHTFDKCGFLPILLIISIMKKNNATLNNLSNDIDKKFQLFHFLEESIEITNQKFNINDLFNDSTLLEQRFKTPISSINNSDGIKITFSNNDWILCRPSGTEPVIRIYSESIDERTAQTYINTAKEFLISI